MSAEHGVPRPVTGKPARAVRAYLVHRAPNGRRLTPTAPEVFGTVIDTRDSSRPLTGASAHGAATLGGCVGVVGRRGDGRVPCRTSPGVLRTMEARTGRAVGAPVGVIGPQDGRVGEMVVVSAEGWCQRNGNRFIVCVHPPRAQQSDNDYGCEDPGFRSVPVTARGTSTSVADPFLDRRTVFVSWS
ncbi:hypothetical protein ACWC4J_25200 [Streptomyces sp. NPDC001356]